MMNLSLLSDYDKNFKALMIIQILLFNLCYNNIDRFKNTLFPIPQL